MEANCMKINGISKVLVAIRMTGGAIAADYRDKEQVRRMTKRWLVVMVLLLVSDSTWTDIAAPASPADATLAVLDVVLSGFILVAGWSALVAAARQPWARAIREDIRTNDRYRAFGAQALLLGFMITAANYVPYDMDFETYFWLHLLTPFVLVRDLVCSGGTALTMALGLVAMMRPSWFGRCCGAIGTLGALNMWTLSHHFRSLWESMKSAATTLVDVVVGAPISAAYDLTGGNPILGGAIALVAFIAVWIPVRRWVMRQQWGAPRRAPQV
jgi:hypothetical protein